jgi:hypothetical protein
MKRRRAVYRKCDLKNASFVRRAYAGFPVCRARAALRGGRMSAPPLALS